VGSPNACGKPPPTAGARDERTLLVGPSALILMEAPSSADRRGTAGAGQPIAPDRGGDPRRFSTQPHQCSWGIAWHARTLARCVLNRAGEVLLHRHLQAGPAPLLQAMAPEREDVVVGVDCLCTWDLAGRSLPP
jgi:hypothetical protein